MGDHSTPTEASRAIVKAMYDAALAGDFETALGHLADDLVVQEPSFLPYGGTYHGVAGFQELFAKIENYLDPYTLSVDEYVAEGDAVVAYIRARTVADGSEVQLTEYSRIRDGKIAEMKIYFHELGALASQIKG